MKVTFKNHHTQSLDFFTVVRKRVDDYFKGQKLSKHGNKTLWIKSLAIIAFQFGLYALLVSNLLSAPFFILTFALFGAATGIMDFIIVHDALHGAYSSNPTLNKLLGYFFDLNGTSSYVWKISHNVLHHTYTNIPGHDGDIDKAIILRLNPKDKLYPFHYYQNIYSLPLYSLVALNWVFYSDYTMFFSEVKKGKVAGKDIAIFLGFKMLNYFLIILIPLLVVQLPIGIILLGYFVASLTAGITISTVFQLAHVVENVEYFEPDESGMIHNFWAVHELLTTSNFATKNRFLTHLIGGLNFQVEHHLFPSICHVHYPALQSIVKRTAEEFNLPYHENLTLFGALCSHFRRLRQLGRLKHVEEVIPCQNNPH